VHGPWHAKEAIKGKYRVKVDPRGKQLCPTMGAMIESMDDNIGRVLDRLETLGLADNTIVVFVSDNGGNIHIERDGHPVTNNEPLRSGKANIHEGGVRVPCIISWPGVVEPGTRCAHPISTIDFYPTLLEMAGIAPKEGHLVDGESFMPLLTGTGTMKRDAIFCHFPHYQPAVDNVPATSVRRGDWKLIRFYGEGERLSVSHTLYNLRDDIGETRDLAGQYPELVQQLGTMIDEHLRDIGGIVPIPNPDYDPAAPAPDR
jgi:arylsulfatase A-like enzyme